MDTIDRKTDVSGERTVVILDVRNVICRQSQEYSNTVIEYGKLLEDTVRGRDCVAAFAVDGVTYEDGKDVCRIFHENLEKVGFKTILVPASNNKGKQEGVDIKIALIAHRFALLGDCDAIELITGDGDFGVLVEELKDEGIAVGITSFKANLSHSLKDMADNVSILDIMPIIRMRGDTTRGGGLNVLCQRIPR